MAFRTSLNRVFFAATLVASAALCASAGTLTAEAATDGILGATSTGRSSIVISVARELRVSNLDDIALGTFDPAAAPLVGTDTICVYDNGLSGYQVTLSSLNGTGQFEMRNGPSVVTYSVEYDDTGTGANYVPVSEGVTLTGRSNVSTSNDTCIALGSDNATVRVRVTTSDASSSSTNGVHSDMLNILVAPSP